MRPPAAGAARCKVATNDGIMTRVSDARALWLTTHILPHEPALRAWLHGRELPGLDIGDIVQETYSRLISAESVDHIRNYKAYAFQTAHSVIASHLRRAKVVSFQNVSDMDQLGGTAREMTPEAEVIGHQELQRLATAIARLPIRVREVFVLRRIEGLAQREVAQRLGLSESTVEKHMSRGFLLLSDFLGRGETGARRTRGKSAKDTDWADDKASESRD